MVQHHEGEEQCLVEDKALPRRLPLVWRDFTAEARVHRAQCGEPGQQAMLAQQRLWQKVAGGVPVACVWGALAQVAEHVVDDACKVAVLHILPAPRRPR